MSATKKNLLLLWLLLRLLLLLQREPGKELGIRLPWVTHSEIHHNTPVMTLERRKDLLCPCDKKGPSQDIFSSQSLWSWVKRKSLIRSRSTGEGPSGRKDLLSTVDIFSLLSTGRKLVHIVTGGIRAFWLSINILHIIILTLSTETRYANGRPWVMTLSGEILYAASLIIYYTLWK